MSTEYAEAVKRDVTDMLEKREPMSHLAAYVYGLIEETKASEETRAEALAAIADALVDYRKAALSDIDKATAEQPSQCEDFWIYAGETVRCILPSDHTGDHADDDGGRWFDLTVDA